MRSSDFAISQSNGLMNVRLRNTKKKKWKLICIARAYSAIAQNSTLWKSTFRLLIKSDEDFNSHLLTLTQLAEESTALTVCPFGQKVRRGGDYLSHSLTMSS